MMATNVAGFWLTAALLGLIGCGDEHERGREDLLRANEASSVGLEPSASSGHDGRTPETSAKVDGRDCADTSEAAPYTMGPQGSAWITFRSDIHPSQFRCGLDVAPATACSSPQQLSGLSEGLHRYSVQAVGPVPQGDPTPAVCVLLVDGTPPSVTFDSSPQVDSCTDGGGMAVSGESGTVTFALTDRAGSDPGVGLRDASCRLLAVPDDVVIDTGDCTAGTYPFAHLANGTYTLEVTATDNLGNQSVQRRSTFRVDASAPIVIPASPRAPVARGDVDVSVGCDGGDACTLFANIKPAEATAGSFLVDVDASTQPITLACTVDGAIVPCTPGLAGGYDISALTEGAVGAPTTHTAIIQATDCVGNAVPAPVTVGFFVDERAPTGTPTAPALTTDNTGSVTATFNIADNVTNVESAFCVVDFDRTTGNNPDTGGAFGESVPCTLDNLLPSQGAGPSGDGTVTVHMATLAMSQLSAGRHRLYVKYADIWGHLSPSWITTDFTVDVTPESFGHAVALGHDFVEAGQDAINLIGNAVELTAIDELPNFDRGINVLVLDLGGANADANGTGRPLDNVLQSILARLQALGACAGAGDCLNVRVFGAESPTEYTKIQSYLFGRDVLLVVDQNDAALSETVGDSAWWRATLPEFVNRGGIAIVLDGRFQRAPSETIDAFDSVLASDSADSGFDPTGADAELDCESDNPLAVDVGQGGPRTYVNPIGSARFEVDPEANEVFSTCQPLDTSCGNYRPVVMDKIFPARWGIGPARVAAWERGSRRNSASFAVFSEPSGNEVEVCRLRQDGTASHDLPEGGTITVASTITRCTVNETLSYDTGTGTCPDTTREFSACAAIGGTCDCTQACVCRLARECDDPAGQVDGCTCKTDKSLQSAYGVNRFETVTIGRSDDAIVTLGRAHVSMAPRGGATSYHVSVGCLSDNGLVATNGTVFTNFTPCVPGPIGPECGEPGWITSRCAVNDAGTWRINVYAEARDAANELEAYAFLSGIPVVAGQATVNVPANAWVPVLDPDRFFVAYGGPAATTTFESADVSLGSAIGAVLYPESRHPLQQVEGIPGPYFSPTSGNVFQDLYRVTGRQQFDADPQPGGVPSFNTLLHNRPAVDPPLTETLDRREFFRRFLTLDHGSATLSWTEGGDGLPLGSADIGMASLLVDPVGGPCEPTRWVLGFPPTGASLTLPDVTGLPDPCYHPELIRSAALGFYANTEPTATVDVARLDFYSFAPDFMRALILDDVGFGSRPPDTTERGAVTGRTFGAGGGGGTGGDGGSGRRGGGGGGCASAGGAAPWLALLALLPRVRRRR